MLFAIDNSGNRVHINSAKRNQEYFCPCCESKLILKLGDQRIHHFAHSRENVCQDGWHYDMSSWHYDWQNEFPSTCQEIVKELNGQKHRADVLLEKERVVYEFQHSNLSAEEFENRNTFYNKLGYKVIWVFDAEDAYFSEQIDNYRGDLWSWKRPRKTLDYFDCKNKNVEIYLQLDEDYLVKVTWCTEDKGFSRFATNGYSYYKDFIIHMFEEKKAEHDIESNATPEVELSELYDTLIELYSKDHTTYFFGCPISSTHMCASCNIDVPKSRYGEIMPCMNCEFERVSDNYNTVICSKRFLDLKLPPDTLIRIEGRDKNGFINKISFLDDNNRRYLDMVTYEQNISKSVFELWKDEYSIATFRNIRTGKYIRIRKNPNEQYRKYHKVYGYFSSDKYNFSKTSCELYGLDKKEWVCEWHA